MTYQFSRKKLKVKPLKSQVYCKIESDIKKTAKSSVFSNQNGYGKRILRQILMAQLEVEFRPVQ